ncbi:uncharacterized protein QC763_506955 [Podospora pseudopauciseta]|uniref:Uncharacterized protein n=2 Tax=Podospora TaxID=5144 RepID=A0ABR0H9M7_9PEZI|nr:hypothetical protein QC763_506955 [Podospora pseudopauciseta]KAK4675865.1 hypothetical protein QC764_506955 [Podospora pseudoanserina]
MIAINLAALFFLSSPILGAVINTDSSIRARSKLVDPAVVFDTWSDTRTCNTDGKSSWTNSDQGCFSLPGQSLTVRSIADTCRSEYLLLFISIKILLMVGSYLAFIYGGTDCSGTEMQVYPGTCYDVRTFHSLKTFCN